METLAASFLDYAPSDFDVGDLLGTPGFVDSDEQSFSPVSSPATIDPTLLHTHAGQKRPYDATITSLSSADMKELKATLPADEVKELKKRRRKLKNRESAQLSRQRKKVYVDDLEVKVEALQTANRDLSQRVTLLSGENKTLKEEVNRLQNLVKQTSTLNAVFDGVKKNGGGGNPNVKAAGVCLAIVLFSFGLFFNDRGEPGGGLLGDAAAAPQPRGATMTGLDAVLKTGCPSLAAVNNAQTPQSRVLLASDDMEDDDSAATEEEEPEENKPSPSVSPCTASRASSPVSAPLSNASDHQSRASTTPSPPLDATAPKLNVAGMNLTQMSLGDDVLHLSPADLARQFSPTKNSYMLWSEAFRITNPSNPQEEPSLLLVPLSSQNRMIACGLES